MAIDGPLPAQLVEELHVHGQGGQPFLPPHHVGDPHQVVVHHVGEVIGGDAVAFQQHQILIVLRHIQLAPDGVQHFGPLFRVAHTLIAQHPGPALGQLFFYLLQRQIPAFGEGAVIAEIELLGLLLLPQSGQLLLRAEAGVGPALFDQVFGHGLIYLLPLPLTVGAVVAPVFRLSRLVQQHALVEGHAEKVHHGQQGLHRARHFPLGVGVLHPEDDETAALVGQPFADGGVVQVAQMHEAGGRRADAGDLGALGQVPRREGRLHIFRGLIYVGEQQFRQLFAALTIHGFSFG